VNFGSLRHRLGRVEQEARRQRVARVVKRPRINWAHATTDELAELRAELRAGQPPSARAREIVAGIMQRAASGERPEHDLRTRTRGPEASGGHHPGRPGCECAYCSPGGPRLPAERATPRPASEPVGPVVESGPELSTPSVAESDSPHDRQEHDVEPASSQPRRREAEFAPAALAWRSKTGREESLAARLLEERF
jgi:hypothetical protein